MQNPIDQSVLEARSPTSRRAFALGTVAAGFGVAGCLSDDTGGPPATQGQSPDDSTSTPTAAPGTPAGVDYIKTVRNREVAPDEPPYPETEAEIQRYRNDLIDEAFERVGHEKDASEPIRVSSLAELSEYTSEDGVHVKMEPGTYEVTRENVGDLMTKNEAWDVYWDKYGAFLFNFDGENTYFDFRDVTITYDTRILNGHWAEPFDYDPGKDIPVLFGVTAPNQVFRGLEVRGIEKDEWEEQTYNPRGAVTWWTEADRIMLWEMSLMNRGSFPYGYATLLGKGGPSAVRVSKHACYRNFGLDNYSIDLELLPRSMGHILGTSNGRMVYINLSVEGEQRTTDEMLAETSGPFHDNDYVGSWREAAGVEPKRPSPGEMRSMGQEDIMRSYNGNVYLKALSCDFRKVQGLSPGKATGLHVANCTFRRCTRRGIRMSSGGTLVNSSFDVRFSKAVAMGGNTSENTVDIEIVPSPTPPEITRHTNIKNQLADPILDYSPVAMAQEGDDQSAAQICGVGHDVTLRTDSVEALHSSLSDPLQPMPILVGWVRHGKQKAEEITLRNETGLPVWLTDSASNCTIETNGSVEDNGSGNDITRI
jgi:hypothetical protein